MGRNPTVDQVARFNEFFKYAKKFDNLRVRYFTRNKRTLDYSYSVTVNKKRSVYWKIKYLKTKNYRVEVYKTSKIRVPLELSKLRFDTPELALDAVIIELRKLNFNIYKLNCMDFIMND